MALVVEDGSGLATADSYVSVEQATAYHAKRASAAWTSATDAQKEAALIRASDYVTAFYTFAGSRTTTGQRLAWPRLGIAGVPEAVKMATAELALRALAGDLAPDNTSSTTLTGTGALIEKKIGPMTLKWDKTGSSTTVKSTGPRFPLVDALLAPLLVQGIGGSMVKLARA